MFVWPFRVTTFSKMIENLWMVFKMCLPMPVYQKGSNSYFPTLGHVVEVVKTSTKPLHGQIRKKTAQFAYISHSVAQNYGSSL